MPDKLDIEILEDGTIQFSTDKISAKNHASADEFMAEIEKLCGGERVVEKRKQKYAHSHAKGVVHSH